MTPLNIDKFIKDQLSVWPLAAGNFRNLKTVSVKQIRVRGLDLLVQFNPCRIGSSEAKIDKATLAARPCFLCPEHRQKEQFNLDFDGRKGRKYRITVNPFPIFPSHLVVSSFEHTFQSIWHRYQDILDFVGTYPSFMTFYNGPASGASAPDHMHFQACPKGLLPLASSIDDALSLQDTKVLEHLENLREASLYRVHLFSEGIFFLRGATSKSVAKLFYRLLDCADIQEGEDEPRFNLLAWNADGEFRTAVIFRDKYRPHHFYSQGPDHLGVSPGAADVGGVFIAPRKENFDKIDSSIIQEIIDEVTLSKEATDRIANRLSRKQQNIEVGIMSADEIRFEIISDGAGPQKASFFEGKISYNGALYDELTFEAQTLSTMFAAPSFILYDVTIGVDFHWQRKVTQQFAGTLKLIVNAGKITAINVIGVEDYLLSVISSEMKSSASLEFLKAHSVISRSWVLSQIEHRKQAQAVADSEAHLQCSLPELVTELDARFTASEKPSDDSELIRWSDRQDHKLFDVCADDHCQRYQGLSMVVGKTVREAIDQTWGLVLTSDGEICDARFSKCCGGRMEIFSTCWEDKEYSYLQPLPDTPDHHPEGESFCDCEDDQILSQVLNDYDLETKDFYRWTSRYTPSLLSDLVKKRSGIDFGDILALVPIERGPSGRLFKMKIIGSKFSQVVGKELTIRKFLSETHLKSSAFTVSYLNNDGETIPEDKVLSAANEGICLWNELVLNGSGWGHGVGLCQIGAAVMSSKGYSYKEILQHYYPGADLSDLRL